MPRLPVTSRSYEPDDAAFTSSSTASPCTTFVSIETPDDAWRAASASTTCWPFSARPAERIVSDAPADCANATARSTAFAAVGDPSVPTRIFSYTVGVTFGGESYSAGPASASSTGGGGGGPAGRRGGEGA